MNRTIASSHPVSFTCHQCNKGNHGDCAGGVNTGGNCTCCPNR